MVLLPFWLKLLGKTAGAVINIDFDTKLIAVVNLSVKFFSIDGWRGLYGKRISLNVKYNNLWITRTSFLVSGCRFKAILNFALIINYQATQFKFSAYTGVFYKW